MNILEKDIEWTTGTDKPYGQVVYEHWKEKLGKNPTKDELFRLENNMLGFKNRAEKMMREHKQVQNNPCSGRHESENLLKLARLYEAAHKRSRELYDSYTKQPEDKSTITRKKIVKAADELKANGMSVKDMFDKISEWLLEDVGFSKTEIKKRFNFSLEDAYSFNRFVNKNNSFHN